jgi:hypothetical protein
VDSADIARMQIRISPRLLSVMFLMLNLALVAGQFNAALPLSERWG